jgi:hypothetical protein
LGGKPVEIKRMLPYDDLVANGFIAHDALQAGIRIEKVVNIQSSFSFFAGRMVRAVSVPHS